MSQTEVCQLLGLSRQVVSDIENDTDSLRCYFKLMGLDIALLPRQRTKLEQLSKAKPRWLQQAV